MYNHPGRCSDNGDDITNLNGLAGVETIEGNLTLTTGNLAQFSGLEDLAVVSGDVTIRRNAKITNFNGLSGLLIVTGDLVIEENPRLATLAGLEDLNFVGGDINVTANVRLRNLALFKIWIYWMAV